MKLIFPNGEHGDVVIRDGTLSIGRGPGNEVLLDDEGIAERHAHLAQEAIGLVIRPVEEADVYLNGRRVANQAPLRAGDVVGVHKVQIRVQEDNDSVAAVAPADEAPEPGPTKVRPALLHYYLRGVSGDSFGRLFPLSARTVIGRGGDCDIVLNVDEVSRRHAAIEVTPDGVKLTDLGSANGTFVNGERLQTAQVRALKRNDEIAFDTLRFRLESTTGRGSVPGPAPQVKAAAKPDVATRQKSKTGWVIAVLVVVIVILLAWFAGWF